MKKLGHIPQLDGLRGAAIVLVLVHHLHRSLAPGGDTGVDLFFVLSGFLITKLMIEERDATNTNDMKAFYIRRTFRLMPALLVAAVGVLVVANVWREDLRDMALTEVLFSVFFAGNLREVFVSSESANLLGVTWSLGLEEQFYWVWPITLAFWPALFAKPLRTVRLVLTVGWVGAIIGRVGFGMFGGYRHYSLIPFFNFDGLLLGAAMAFLFHYRAVGPARIRVHGGWVVIAFGLLMLDFVFSDSYREHDYGMRNVLARICFAALIWWLLTDGWRSVLARALAHPILRYFGRISYSLYLWHTLVFAAFHLDDPTGDHRILRKVTGLVLSLAVSTASYYSVERPAQRMRHRLTARRAARQAPAPTSGRVPGQPADRAASSAMAADRITAGSASAPPV